MEQALTKAIKVLEKVREHCGQNEEDVFLRTEIQEAIALLRDELYRYKHIVPIEPDEEETYSLIEYGQEKL